MEKDGKLTEKQCRQLALYSTKIIHSYLQDVCAAAYPQTPEQVGGASYQYFSIHWKNIERMLNGENMEDILAETREQRKTQQGPKP